MVTVVAFIVILGLLVLVHEYGHYWVARRAGVAVEEFAIGFPPRIISWVRKGTRYSFNLIPFGGFVRLAGEGEGNPSGPDGDADLKPAGISLFQASRWRRAAIMFAGVAMNFLLGAVLLGIGFGIGLPQVIDGEAPANARDVRIQIISVSADSPAAAAGLQPGDAIVSLDGQPTTALEQVQGYTASHAGQPIALGVRRNGQQLDLTLTPKQLPESEGRAVVGVSLAVVGRVAVPWWRAPWEGLAAAWSLVVAILVGLGGIIAKLFSGGGPVDVAGPIGVAVLTGQAVQLGWLYVLQFVAVLSINLAVINLLPLPALDGGRLAVLGLEGISRRSLPEKLEQNLHRFGFGALIALLILVTVVDARRFGAGIWNAVVGLFS